MVEGRRGLVGLFATHGAKGRRFESRSFLSFVSRKEEAVRLRKVSRQEERENEAAAQERREQRKNGQANQERSI